MCKTKISAYNGENKFLDLDVSLYAEYISGEHTEILNADVSTAVGKIENTLNSYFLSELLVPANVPGQIHHIDAVIRTPLAGNNSGQVLLTSVNFLYDRRKKDNPFTKIGIIANSGGLDDAMMQRISIENGVLTGFKESYYDYGEKGRHEIIAHDLIHPLNPNVFVPSAKVPSQESLFRFIEVSRGLIYDINKFGLETVA